MACVLYLLLAEPDVLFHTSLVLSYLLLVLDQVLRHLPKLRLQSPPDESHKLIGSGILQLTQLKAQLIYRLMMKVCGNLQQKQIVYKANKPFIHHKPCSTLIWCGKKLKGKGEELLEYLKSSGICLGFDRIAWIAFVVTKILLLCKPMVGTSVFRGTGAFSRIFSVEGLWAANPCRKVKQNPLGCWYWTAHTSSV